MGDFSWEEVNHIVKGGNYGWPLHEGLCTSELRRLHRPDLRLSPRRRERGGHRRPGLPRRACSRPSTRATCSSATTRRGSSSTPTSTPNGDITAVHDFDDQAGSVVDLKVAPDGSLYYITYYPGALYRVSYNTTSHVPVAKASADVTKGVEPLTVHFSSAGSRDPDGDPLSYHWTFGDGTTSTEANPTKTYAEKGVYTARLTVSAGGEESHGAADRHPGRGSARADRLRAHRGPALPGRRHDHLQRVRPRRRRLRPRRRRHQDRGPAAPRHPLPPVRRAADRPGRLVHHPDDRRGVGRHLVRDQGDRDRQQRPVHQQGRQHLPAEVAAQSGTSPPGLGLLVDGVPVSTPRTVTGVEGFQRELSAPNRAVAQDGTALQFAGWSDGKSIRHVITTPEDDTTYTATYQPSQPFTASTTTTRRFSGAPVLTRQDPTINFAWGAGSPRSGRACRRLLGPLDQDAVVRRRPVQVHRPSPTTASGSTSTASGSSTSGRARRTPSSVTSSTSARASTRSGWSTSSTAATRWRRSTWDSAPDQPTDAYRARVLERAAGRQRDPGHLAGARRDEEAIDHDWGEGSPGARHRRSTASSPAGRAR